MKLKITTFRGHHECEVAGDVGQSLFDKLTGRSTDALPADLRTAVPDTFAELDALWNAGKMGYSAFNVNDKKEFETIKDFNGDSGEIVFIAPITGG